MKFRIVSWNIRHFRAEKIQDYWSVIRDETCDAHLAFFYENKMSNNTGGKTILKLKDKIASSSKFLSPEYKYYVVPVGTDENVLLFCALKPKTGKNSKYGAGRTFEVAISADDVLKNSLYGPGEEKLKSSKNLTVLTNLAWNKSEFRVPAIVDVQITRPDKTTKTFKIAAWHAPGPAMGMAEPLWEAYKEQLADHVDVYVGDFNFPGTETSKHAKVALVPTGTSTTFTKSGLVPHQEGLDLVFRNTDTIAPSKSQFGTLGASYKAWLDVDVSLIDAFPTWEEAFEMTDHRPVIATLHGI
jgi:hypothetical protein